MSIHESMGFNFGPSVEAMSMLLKSDGPYESCDVFWNL